jgi:hypothetical protein
MRPGALFDRGGAAARGLKAGRGSCLSAVRLGRRQRGFLKGPPTTKDIRHPRKYVSFLVSKGQSDYVPNYPRREQLGHARF